MNVDGSGARRLIREDGRQGLLDWSPDGRRIAFSSTRDGNWDIYVMNGDGSGVRRLTDHPAIDDGPRWSPDGRSILFNSSRGSRWGIYLMDSEGGEIRHLTKHHQMNVLGPAAGRADGVLRLAVAPAWSPDGRRIAFDSTRDGNWEIYTMAADGSDVRRLTTDAADDTRARWSPDGRRIAFQSWRHGGGMEVFVMNADGTDVRRLTFTTRAP
ncbi:MAG: hypothetical protein ACRELD_03445 [Longimicrobiales bacterium]